MKRLLAAVLLVPALLFPSAAQASPHTTYLRALRDVTLPYTYYQYGTYSCFTQGASMIGRWYRPGYYRTGTPFNSLLGLAFACDAAESRLDYDFICDYTDACFTSSQVDPKDPLVIAIQALHAYIQRTGSTAYTLGTFSPFYPGEYESWYTAYRAMRTAMARAAHV